MNSIRRTLLTAATVFIAAPLLYAQASESAIIKQFEKLSSVSAAVAYSKPASGAIIKLAADIRTLRAGRNKVEFADNLAHMATKGDQGEQALQAVADALSQALAESPMKAKKDQPPAPYFDLARLIRYENVHTTLNDPLFAQANKTLIDNDADVQKADFTLKDMKGKKYTLSELRGKIVLINFWATGCPLCLQEMPVLDFIYTHYQSQGLVILSITDEDPYKVSSFMRTNNYHPPVLIDTGGKVTKQFHVTVDYIAPASFNTGGKMGKQNQIADSGSLEGLPRSFVFNREGKLVGEAIDQCTQRQFYEMLVKTDLQP